jgi:hypothetical protein
MSPAQLSALAGEPAALDDIEDLVAPPPRPSTSAPVTQQSADPVFDAARHAETRRPLLQASTMQSDVYTSEAWFAEEQSVLERGWTMVAG